jgi:hypothetical protein
MAYTTKQLLAAVAASTDTKVRRMSKTHERPCIVTNPRAAVTIWEDRSITACDLPLEDAKKMTPREAAKFLGLTS